MGKPQSKYNYFGLVFNAKKESPNTFEELEQISSRLLSINDLFISTIIHDRDTDSNGELKRTHLHAYIESAEKYTEKQLLSLVCEFVELEPVQVSISGSNNEFLLAQYLVHKNDPKKYQYELADINSNDIEKLHKLIENKTPTKEQQKNAILGEIKDSKTLLELAEKVGLDIANKYRPTFNQIKQEQRQDFDGLIKENQKLYQFIDKLDLLTKAVYFDGSQSTEFFRAVQDLFLAYFEQLKINY